MMKTIETQICIYSSYFYKIGGIETFIYNFCLYFKDKYDILILYDRMDEAQLRRLRPMVQTIQNSSEIRIKCDTFINNRITDKIPDIVTYKKSVQMVHCIKQMPEWKIPQDKDVIVNVSEASRKSFKEEAAGAVVINNLLYPEPVKKSLLLVSAMRVGAKDKQGNDERCIKLCEMMKKADIPFLWIYFGDRQMKQAPDGMIYGGCTLNIKPYIAKADYLVQLSGSEAFSYSMYEALSLKTPLICTDLEQNNEMGIIDGLNAYIVPFDLEQFEIKKILNIPASKYDYQTPATFERQNNVMVNRWRKILGNAKKKSKYDPGKMITVEIIGNYYDVELKRKVEAGEVIDMQQWRSDQIISAGFGKEKDG